MNSQPHVARAQDGKIYEYHPMGGTAPDALTEVVQPDEIELEIRAERVRQDAKFGAQSHDPFKWLAILGEEVGEVNKAALDAFDFKTGQWTNTVGDWQLGQGIAHYREELIQVAAVAKAMIQCIDRGEGLGGLLP